MERTNSSSNTHLCRLWVLTHAPPRCAGRKAPIIFQPLPSRNQACSLRLRRAALRVGAPSLGLTLARHNKAAGLDCCSPSFLCASFPRPLGWSACKPTSRLPTAVVPCPPKALPHMHTCARADHSTCTPQLRVPITLFGDECSLHCCDALCAQLSSQQTPRSTCLPTEAEPIQNSALFRNASFFSLRRRT